MVFNRNKKVYFTLTEFILFMIFYGVVLSFLLPNKGNLSQFKITNTINDINYIKAKYNRFVLKYGEDTSMVEKTIVVDTNLNTNKKNYDLYNELLISRIPSNEKKNFAIINIENEPYLFIGVDSLKSELKNNTLTPLEAFIIDNKLDDGVPTTGSFRVYDGDNNSDCYYGNYYNTKNNKRVCSLIYHIE